MFSDFDGKYYKLNDILWKYWILYEIILKFFNLFDIFGLTEHFPIFFIKNINKFPNFHIQTSPNIFPPHPHINNLQ